MENIKNFSLMVSRLITTFLILLFLSHNVFAQNKMTEGKIEESEDTKETSVVKLSGSYLSNSIYQGRKPEEVQSLISVGAGYYHKSGLFINGSISYIPNPGFNKVDRKALTAGYEFYGDKLNVGAYFANYFYNDSSSEINSAINSSAGISSSYNFNLLSIGAAADFNFLTKTDIVLNANISHPFSLANNNLHISPIINMNCGTEYFYQSYFSPNKKNGTSAATRAATKRKRNLANNTPINNTSSTTTTTVTVLNANAFKILDYEFSVPIEVTINKFMLSSNPIFILPVNAASISYNNVTTKEALKNAFVLEAGISYTF